MMLTKQMIDDIMTMFNEERLPISVIASNLKCSMSDVDAVICGSIANNIVEIV